MKIGTLRVGVEVDQSKLVKGLNDVGKKTSKLGKIMSNFATQVLKRGMQVGFAALTAYIGKSIYNIAKFQTQMQNVSTMLNEANKKHLPEFTEGIKDMSIEFGESTESLSKGLYDILSASVDADKAMDVLRVSSIAAAAGLTDTGVAADAITTIINSYALSADRAADVSDLLFSIVLKGKTTFAELAPNIGKVASLAATANLSLDELGASLATMTRAGIRTDIAITSLRSLMSAFTKSTDESKRAAAELGIELSTTTLKEEGLLSVIKKLEKATPEQVSQIFGNVRALTGLSSILQNTTGYMSDLDTMSERAGATQAAFEDQTKSLGYQLSQLRRLLEAAAITTGEELADEIKKLVEYIKANKDEILEFARNLGKSIVTMVRHIEKLIGWLGKIKEFWENIPDVVKKGLDIMQSGVEMMVFPVKGLLSELFKDAKKTVNNTVKEVKEGAEETIKVAEEVAAKRISLDLEAYTNRLVLSEKEIVELETAQAKKSEDFQEFSDALGESWAGNLTDMVMGTQKFAEGVENIFKDMINFIINQISRAIAKWLTFMALQAVVPGAGFLEYFQHGVRNFAGGMAVVGEAGPELVRLPKGSDVFSNKESRGIVNNNNSMGGDTINISIHAVVKGDEDWNNVTRKHIIPALDRYKRKTKTSPFS